jgi:thiol-disulfide isomerase/thioredoxin
MKKVIYVSCALFFCGLVVLAVFKLKSLAPAIVPHAKLEVLQDALSQGKMAHNNTEKNALVPIAPEFQHVGGRCPKEKCLIIMMTPWCPKCQEIQPVISILSNKLSEDDIPVSVVIGDDAEKNIREFASKFESRVLIDPQNQLFSRISIPGTPYFAVVNRDGVVVNDLAGFIADATTLRQSLNL